jgi:XTP/dITP diphosphohydrolase
MNRHTPTGEGKRRSPLQFVLATANQDKVVEMRQAMQGLSVELLTRAEFPGIPPVLEDGATLEENALKKARAVCAATGIRSIADDTGLEVAALHGAPGVHSSRYAGPGATYADNVAKLLRALEGVPMEGRGARFRCVVALVEPVGAEVLVEGICEGVIITEPRGAGGFGYDPIVAPVEGDGRTFGEMTADEKHAISHRARAFRDLVPHLT